MYLCQQQIGEKMPPKVLNLTLDIHADLKLSSVSKLRLNCNIW